jgi:RimJ/RimL family protein N-acetyltransferase
MSRKHALGFHVALDSVAREGRYLAMLEAPPLSRIRRFVSNNLKEGAPQFVALVDGLVVGWCDIKPHKHPTLRHGGVLGMGIVREHRGRGIGGELLEETLAAARTWGMSRVELIVRADNAAAIALYRKFGFELEGTLRRYMKVGADFQDALMMARLY